METIDVGKEFNSRLTDRSQATIFIDKYLIKLLDKSIWANDDPFITLDFVNVQKISPSFASQAFASL